MLRGKSPPAIRYSVMAPGQSGLCAQHTPTFFNERQKRQAEEYAAKVGSYVFDMEKEYRRRQGR